MTDGRMPTTLPSPADRGEFDFVAVDASGTAWRWIDRELVWVPVKGKTDLDDPEADGCDVLH